MLENEYKVAHAWHRADSQWPPSDGAGGPTKVTFV